MVERERAYRLTEVLFKLGVLEEHYLWQSLGLYWFYHYDI